MRIMETKLKHFENYAIVFDGSNFASSKTNNLKSSVMTTISVHTLSQAKNLQRGSVTLIGSTGIHYKNPALYIPNYGWVPCSKKLQSDFSAAPKDLTLVISDTEDDYIPVTSSIWVTRSRA